MQRSDDAGEGGAEGGVVRPAGLGERNVGFGCPRGEPRAQLALADALRDCLLVEAWRVRARREGVVGGTGWQASAHSGYLDGSRRLLLTARKAALMKLPKARLLPKLEQEAVTGALTGSDVDSGV